MYEKWHRNSPRKSKFFERTDNHDRAIRAGLNVASGILFGLSDYKYDVLMQIGKARYLRDEYGTPPFVFGTARLKPISGMKIHSKYAVEDMQYELSLMVYKIATKIPRWLQTRETIELNLRNMLDGDFITYECGDVKPGGYQVNRDMISSLRGSQFKVNELDKDDFEMIIRPMGFRVDYAWISR